ncbi:MAG: hypothetical protein QF441_01425 [Bacteriovoracaceae bacterium]|nr:hypothetical protein [Halobacteriovoraceae bacterium]MDP7319232.1 hypothetical protein [Bacteriovoracaceae bacterium]
MYLKITGRSSQTSSQVLIRPDEFNLSLLNFLLKKNFPIASSCRGEQICQKCVVNTNILSCSLSVKEFLMTEKEVQVDYL